MTPITARRRPTRRRAPRWRQGPGRGAAEPATLFDGSPGEPRAAAGAVWTAHPTAGAAPIAAGSGETLDRLVVASWERLVSRATAPCPLCGATMEPGGTSASAGGRCRDCGTTLV